MLRSWQCEYPHILRCNLSFCSVIFKETVKRLSPLLLCATPRLVSGFPQGRLCGRKPQCLPLGYSHDQSSLRAHQHINTPLSARQKCVLSPLCLSIDTPRSTPLEFRGEQACQCRSWESAPVSTQLYLTYHVFRRAPGAATLARSTNISCKHGVPQTTPAASKFGTLVIDVNRHTSHHSPLTQFNMHVFRFVAKGSPVLLRFVAPFSLRVAHLCRVWVLRRCIPAYLLSSVLVGAIPTSAHASRWAGG